MESAFELLSRRSLKPNNIIQTIQRWSPEELISFADEWQAEVIQSQQLDGRVKFFANTSLSGGPSPCADVACRISNIVNIAKFAILYSDRVAIRDRISPRQLANIQDFDLAKYELISELRVLHAIKPLLEKGIVQIVPGSVCLCKVHLRK